MEGVHQRPERVGHVLRNRFVLHQQAHRNPRYFGIHARAFEARTDRHPDEIQLVVGVREGVGKQCRGNVRDFALQLAGDAGLIGKQPQRAVGAVFTDEKYAGLRFRVDLAYEVLVAVLDRVHGGVSQFDLRQVFERDPALRPPVDIGQ